MNDRFFKGYKPNFFFKTTDEPLPIGIVMPWEEEALLKEMKDKFQQKFEISYEEYKRKAYADVLKHPLTSEVYKPREEVKP
jgi:hypothetical protein